MEAGARKCFVSGQVGRAAIQVSALSVHPG
jgi:hypothetical protein